MLLSLKKTAIAGLAALTLTSAIAAPAQAWGKKEQGFVAGIATALVIDQLLQQSQGRAAPARPQPQYGNPYPQQGGYYGAPQGHRPPPPPQYGAPQRPAPQYGYQTPGQAYSSVHTTPAGAAFKTYSLSQRKAIQSRLRSYGYYTGAIDGLFGTGTYNAVTSYARASGMQQNLTSNGGAYAVYDGLIYR